MSAGKRPRLLGLRLSNSIFVTRKGDMMQDIALHNLGTSLDRLASNSHAQPAFAVLLWLCFTSRPLKIVELNDIVRFSSSQASISAISVGPQQVLQEQLSLPENLLDIFDGYPSLVKTVSSHDEVDSRHAIYGRLDSVNLVNLIARQGNITIESADAEYPIPAPYSNYDRVEIHTDEVKRYLTSEKIRSSEAARFAVDSGDAQVYIARTCLEYLSRFDYADALSPKTSLNKPAAIYCANVWDHHVRLASESGRFGDVRQHSVRAVINKEILRNIFRLSSSTPESVLPPTRIENVPSALIYASQKGMRSLCEALIQEGADVRFEATRYMSSIKTPLIAAAFHGHADVIELLLDSGLSPDHQQIFQNWTALQGASDRGHLAAAKVLLDRGADIERQGFDNMTAIEQAAYSGATSGNLMDGGVRTARYIAMLEFLLERGARPRTAIVYAAQMDNMTLMRIMLNKSDNINLATSQGETALVRAVSYASPQLVSLLLQRGASLEGTDRRRKTPIQIALERGREEIVDLLIKAGAILPKDSPGASSTLFAARNAETIALLLDNGADVNARNDRGSTLLHYAVSYHKPEVIKLLLEHGADPHAKDGNERTPFFSASFGSANLNNPEIVSLLIEAGADINARDINGSTPLIDAGTWGRVEPVLQLLDAGADITASDSSGRTVLLAAAASGSAEVVECVLDRGVTIDTADFRGRSVLHYAVLNDRVEERRRSKARDLGRYSGGGDYFWHRQLDAYMEQDAIAALAVVTLLLNRGANVSASDAEGMTPLHFAANRGYLGIVNTLLRNGANTTAQNQNGTSAVDLARHAGYDSIVDACTNADGQGNH